MAVRFDAANDRYLGGAISGNTATVLCWAYISNDRNNYSNIWIIYSDTETTTVAGLGSDVDGTSMLLFDSAFTTLVGPNMVANTWYCFAAVMSGTAWSLYYGTDPQSLTLVSATRVALSSPPTFTISNGTEWFDGRVANWKIYTAALTAQEIQNELAQYQPVRTANLLEYRPFVNAETIDYSGNARSLTAGAGTATTEAGPPIRWDGHLLGRHSYKALASAVSVNAGSAAIGWTARTVAAINESPNVGFAAAGVAGQNPTVSISKSTNVGTAGIGISNNPGDVTAKVSPNVGVATWAVAGQNPSTSTGGAVSPAAGNAAVGWATTGATIKVSPNVGAAAVSWTARAPTVANGTLPTPTAATLGIAANNAQAKILVSAGLASVGLAAYPVLSGNLQLACANLSATIALERLFAAVAVADRHSALVVPDRHNASVGADEAYATVGVCGRS